MSDRLRRDHLWNTWLEYFTEVEYMETELQAMNDELDGHIAMEHYGDAAQTQQRIEEFCRKDVVARVHERLDEAVKEERFDDATRLRDEGLVGLTGWWIARGPNDPRGRLVYFQRDFCRYSGRIFTPREIGHLCGVSDHMMLEPLLTDTTTNLTDACGIEVYVKQEHNEAFQHQASVLRTPSLDDSDSSDVVLDIPSLQKPEMIVQARTGRIGRTTRLTITIIHNDSDIIHSLGNLDEEIAATVLPEKTDDEDEIETNEEDDEDDELTAGDLQYRMPADIKWWDRNRFVLSVDEEAYDSNEAEEDGEDDSSLLQDYQEEMTKAKRPVQKEILLQKLMPRIRNMAELMEYMSHAWKSATVHDTDETPLDDSASDGDVSMESEGTVEVLPRQRMENATESHDLEGEVMFTRLPRCDGRESDPFTGFFLGHFAHHGPELLYLSRQKETENGKEIVYAKKITGDENVPAGEICFQAIVDRSNRTVPDIMHAEQLGIRFRYSGKGRIAEHGFTNATWVNGDLLVFDSRSPIAGGAELALIWNHSHLKKAHVLLHRVSLSERNDVNTE